MLVLLFCFSGAIEGCQNLERVIMAVAKEAEDLFELGVKVFSNSGKISDEGLNVLLRQRDPKRQLPLKPSEVVDWSFLPTKLE
jgi:hypothetical protein